MGQALASRLAGSSVGRARGALLGAATAAVAVVAVGVLLAGLPGEAVATLLFLPVLAAGLLGGRGAGYLTALLATLVYVAVRRDDLGSASAAAAGALTVARAGCYLVAGHVAALARALLPDGRAAVPARPVPGRAGPRGAPPGRAGPRRRAGPVRAPIPDDEWEIAPPVPVRGHDRARPVLAGVAPSGAGGFTHPGDDGRSRVYPDTTMSGGWPPEPGGPARGPRGGAAHRPGHDDRAAPPPDPWPPVEPSWPGPHGREGAGGAAPPGSGDEEWGASGADPWAPPAPAGGWPPGAGGGPWAPPAGGEPSGGWGAPGGQWTAAQVDRGRGARGDQWGERPADQGWGAPGDQWGEGPADQGWGERPAEPEWGAPADQWGEGPADQGWGERPAEPEWGAPAEPEWRRPGGGMAAGAAPAGWDPPGAGHVPPSPAPPGSPPAVDPETGLWTAKFLRDRLTAERARSRRTGHPFSLVLVQVPDGPLASLPYRRQVALLRELGYQLVAGGVVDHLVHVPDQAQHWFAVVLADTDRSGAHVLERRLRLGIGGYLSSRGLRLRDLESASLTAPDDDPAMRAIWDALIGPEV